MLYEVITGKGGAGNGRRVAAGAGAKPYAVRQGVVGTGGSESQCGAGSGAYRQWR